MSNEKINFNVLKKYLRSKFPNRERAPDREIYNLACGLRESYIHNFYTLDSIVNRHLNWFLEYENNNPPMGGGKFYDTGVIVVILLKTLR